MARKIFARTPGGRLEVLRDIAFTLPRGEVAAFVGPSGCGKTTMLRIIAGLDRDFEGTVARRFDGAIGMVFQEPRLLPWRTVDENVRLVAPGATDAKLTALFDTLELAPHRWHYPGELSLGLARRCALARAFAVEASLLILDEPFVSLDDALAARLRGELIKLIDSRPVTTLLVTHDVDEAIGLADRLFLLSAGPARILAELPIKRRDPASTAAIRAEIARVTESMRNVSCA
ncbi:MAG: ATP-binding cassette domain-containing protein [Bradyrhizobiaceae bacterium]|nr:ATP-binding cassette domain-containing protein [Bradyrhizobiaceae bacterium]